MRMPHTVFQVLLGGALISSSILAGGQQDFRKASNDALALAQAGKGNSAIQTAKNTFDGCPQGAPGKECRALLSFSMGFIEQKQAETSTNPDEARGILLRARRYYETSLAEDPDNGVVHFNLALLLRSTGNTDVAIEELKKAIATDPPRAWEYNINLGDLYAQNRDMAAALNAYQAASQSAPAAETPLWRMVDVAIPAGVVPGKLEPTCEKLEITFPEIAAACYEHVLNAANKNDQALAEKAFLAWLTLLAGNERLTENSLQAIPASSNEDIINNVRGLLRGDDPRYVPGWWRSSRERRKAHAALLLLVGHRFPSRGPQYAEECWQTGLESVKDVYEPEPGPYGFPLSPVVTINLYQELALLYLRYSDVGSNAVKLRDLVNEMFAMKGEAIQSHNLEAEQRFHNLLGIIFLQQKNWGVDGNPRSAAYQLRRTVEVADERYKTEGLYQPLAQIKELRARGYREHGQTEQANQSLLNAALAYMDSDELIDCARIIAQLPDNAADKTSLSTVLRLRQVASQGVVSPDLLAQVQSLSAGPDVGADFVQRQQFKILGDLVRTSSNANDKETLQHALDAFDLAVNKRVALVGARDLIRWQAVQGRVLDSVGARTPENVVRGPGNRAGTSLKLSLPGHTSPENVEVPETTAHAAQISRILGPEKVVQMRSQVFYDGTKLSVPASRLENVQMKDQLKAAGVTVAAH